MSAILAPLYSVSNSTGVSATAQGEPVDEIEIVAMPSPASRSYGVAEESGEVVSVVERPALVEPAGEVLAGEESARGVLADAGEVLAEGVEAAELATMGLDSGSDEPVVPGEAASLDVDPFTEAPGSLLEDVEVWLVEDGAESEVASV